MEINIMKKEYTLILTTTEEKSYNKFNHLIMERIDNELQCLDIVKEDFYNWIKGGMKDDRK